MTEVLSRLQSVRRLLAQRAELLVETRRGAYLRAVAAVERRDHQLRGLAAEAQDLGGRLVDPGWEAELRRVVLERIDAITDDSKAVVEARERDIAVTAAAASRLDEARRSLARARTRLSGADILARAVLSVRAKRRERLAECELEGRRQQSQPER
jgi:hypothetical protein